MPEGDELNNEKPVIVKGVDTAVEELKKETERKKIVFDTDSKDKREVSGKIEDVPSSVAFEKPKTKEEAFRKNLSQLTGSTSFGETKGSSGSLDPSIMSVLAKVDLAKAIPDHWERTQYIDQYGSKLVDLLDGKSYGALFENDIVDLAKFKEKQYDSAIKNFVDDLDENQAWYQEIVNTGAKFIGETALSVSSVIPLVYGLGSAFFNQDSSKIFDNTLFDAWEYMNDSLEENLVVYGGTDIWNYNSDTKEFTQKEFFARFINDPVKSLNADIVPAASFIAGAVISEILAAAVAPVTGGASLTANTARIAATGSKFFSKSYRVARGLDNLNDVSKAAEAISIADKFKSVLGTAASGVRSASYESALIARSTQEQTYETLVQNHLATGAPLSHGDELRYRELASDAGTMAFRMNIPLVAGSNFVQMPRLFMRNWKFAKSGANLMSKYKLGGTRIGANGKVVANANANKALKYFGYSTAATKGLVTEAWEELAQGGMEEGLIDYYAAPYSKEGVANKTSLLSTIAKSTRAFAGTAEGRDSMTIGGLMGMLGMRIPGIKIDQETGKTGFSLLGTSFGGAIQEVKDVSSKMQRAQQRATMANAMPTNEMLAENFGNMMRHSTFQKNMDDSAYTDNINEFKNQEFNSMFSFVASRHALGISDVIFQELDAMKKLPLEKFNHDYGTDNISFTEESKSEILNKATQRIQSILDGINDIESITNNKKVWVDNILKTFDEGAFNNISKEEFAKGLISQLTYLHSTSINTDERIKEISDIISSKTKGTLSLNKLNDLDASISGVKEGTADFKTTSRDTKGRFKSVKKEIMDEWKESNPVDYSLHKPYVEALVDDVIKLKKRQIESVKLYNALFTNKGIKEFAKFADILKGEHDKELIKQQKEQLDKDAEQANNPSQVNKVADDEKSVYGNAGIVDKHVNEGVINGLEEYKKTKNTLDDQGAPGDVVNSTLLTLLDKHPKMFTYVKKLLEDQIELSGINNVDELFAQDLDGQMQNIILNKLNELLGNLESIKSTFFNNPTPEDPVMNGKDNESDALADLRKRSEEGRLFQSGKPSTPIYTILATHDKKFKDGELVRDSKGKPVPHVAIGDDFYLVNPAIINDPDFLSNSEIEDSSPEIEFRISETDYNDRAETTNENLVIDAVYVDSVTGKETVIGQLPAYTSEHADQLLELRNAIVERQKKLDELKDKPDGKKAIALIEKKRKLKESKKSNIEIEKKIESLKQKEFFAREEKETLEATPDIEAQKADIEKRRQEELGDLKLSDAESGIQKLSDAEKQTLIAQQQALLPDPDSVDSYEEYQQLEEEIKASKEWKELEIQIKEEDTRIDKINKKYDKELAALETKEVDTVEIDKEIKSLTDSLQDVSKVDEEIKNIDKELQEFASDEIFVPTPSEVDDLIFADVAAEEEGMLYSKEDVAKARIINNEFKNIMEMIGDSDIAIFFDEDGQHKDCE
jgi:hypothetical protein